MSRSESSSQQKNTGSGDHGECQESLQEEWLVVHPRMAVRDSPSTTADIVSAHKKGDVVRGVPTTVDGVPWLKLSLSCAIEGEPRAAWMLIDGEAVGLGRLLERREPPPDSAPGAPTKPAEPAEPEPPYDLGRIGERPTWG